MITFEDFLIETNQPVNNLSMVAREIVSQADSGKPLETVFSKLTGDMSPQEQEQVAALVQGFMDKTDKLKEWTII